MPLDRIVFRIGIVAFAGVVAAPRFALGQTFSSQSYSVGTTPNSVLGVDLNADGFPDLIVVNNGSASFSVLLGTGTGTFASAVNVATLASSVEPGMTDVDGDGRIDLVVPGLDNGSRAIAVHFGDGSGGFGAANETLVTGAATNPAGVAILDLDNDGTSDVALGTAGNAFGLAKVSTLRSHGDGSFDAPISYDASTFFQTGMKAIAAADFDGDGAPDLIFNGVSNIGICRNNGAGGLNAATYLSTANVYSWALGDLNGDGVADCALGAKSLFLSQDGIQSDLGNGAGGFAPFPPGQATPNSPRAIRIADLNSDGKQDVLVVSGGVAKLHAHFGNGNGALGAAVAIADVSAGVVNRAFAVGDWNADGSADFATVDPAANTVTVLLNQSAPHGGTSSYGIGTSGCSGRLGMGTNSDPTHGNASFAITSTNAPVRSLGLCFVADVRDPAGTDLFYLGLKMHLGLLSATEVYSFDTFSDPSGSAYAPAPIPDDAGLIGKTYYAQSIWLEPATYRCTTAQFGLVSARGVAFTIQ